MSHLLLKTTAFIAFIVPSILLAASNFVEIPPCGITSVYGILFHLDRDVSLDTIRKRFNELYPDNDPTVMSMSQVNALLGSFGLHTRAVKTNLANLRNDQLPAILCITNNVKGQELPVGHVLLLRHLVKNKAVLIDYQTGHSLITVSLDDLQKMSDGMVLLVSPNSMRFSFFWNAVASILTIFTSLLGIVAILCSFIRPVREKEDKTKTRSNIPVSVGLLLLCCCIGCNRNEMKETISNQTKVKKESTATPLTAKSSKPKSILNKKPTISTRSAANSLLIFENCIKDHGVFQCGRDPFEIGPEGAKVEFEFPFVVGKNDVVIEKIDASCGCVISDQNLIGKSLPASSKQTLKMMMDVRGRCGKYWTQAQIVTKPKANEPIMLQMEAFVKQLPEVSPSKLRIRNQLGKSAGNVELNVS